MNGSGRHVVKVPGGKLLKLDVTVKDGLISELRIRGDFFANPEEGFDRAEASLIGTKADGFSEALDAALRREGVELFGVSPADIKDAYGRALDANFPA